jgi:hypothetical protein
MQWPMCLVYQKENHKVLSVSRKKIVCHEGVYANFDPTHTNIPQASILEIDPRPDDPEDEPRIEGVHSIKVLREARMNKSMNDLSHQPANQGEKLYEIDSYLDEDSLLDKLNQNKAQTDLNKSTHQEIANALKNITLAKQRRGRPKDEKEVFGADVSARNILKERRNLKEKKRKAEIKVGDNVRIKTARFGKKYAKGLPEYTHGKVVGIKGAKAGVV